MPIRRISSGGSFEARVGYCRAVVAGGFVHVAGTTAQGDDVPDDVVGQCRSALSAVGDALAEAGATFADVVRVTYVLPDRDDFEPCWAVLAATFGQHPPAATMIAKWRIAPLSPKCGAKARRENMRWARSWSSWQTRWCPGSTLRGPGFMHWLRV